MVEFKNNEIKNKVPQYVKHKILIAKHDYAGQHSNQNIPLQYQLLWNNKYLKLKWN